MNKELLKIYHQKPDLYKKVKIKQNLIAYAFLAIPLILLGIFTFFPLIQGIYISFLDYNIMNNSTVGGPIAFGKAFISNFHSLHNPILTLSIFLLSIIFITVLAIKRIFAKYIWTILLIILAMNILLAGSVFTKTFQDINYSIEEDRTFSNDLVPRYIEMLQEQYGKKIHITKEPVNTEETRVYIKQSTWVGLKYYRAIITNLQFAKFVKNNVWYFYMLFSIIIGLLLLRLVKQKRAVNRRLDLSLKTIIIIDIIIFAIISWFQIFNSQSWSFYQALKNSLVYILVVPTIQIASILLAILVNQKLKGITFFRTLYYVPVITGVVIIGYCWKFIYQPNGLLDATLALIHLKPLSWLGDSRIALFSIMFVTFWRGLGYYMILYLAGIQDVSNELLEAARIDGASTFHLITKIYIPLLRRTILVCTLLSTIAALRIFEEIFVLSGGTDSATPMNGTMTMVYMIFDKAFGKFGLQFSYSAALAVLLSIVIAIITVLNFKFERGYDQ